MIKRKIHWKILKIGWYQLTSLLTFRFLLAWILASGLTVPLVHGGDVRSSPNMCAGYASIVGSPCSSTSIICRSSRASQTASCHRSGFLAGRSSSSCFAIFWARVRPGKAGRPMGFQPQRLPAARIRAAICIHPSWVILLLSFCWPAQGPKVHQEVPLDSSTIVPQCRRMLFTMVMASIRRWSSGNHRPSRHHHG